jgi:hypothetical protein
VKENLMPLLQYVQRTGRLLKPSGALLVVGYSGDDVAGLRGLNNPDLQSTARVGPIPVGLYTIHAPLDPPDHLGPIAMALIPSSGNQMFGRSAFFMHGDNAQMDHTASEGCIVVLKIGRIWVCANCVGKQLRVVAEDVDAVA